MLTSTFSAILLSSGDSSHMLCNISERDNLFLAKRHIGNRDDGAWDGNADSKAVSSCKLFRLVGATPDDERVAQGQSTGVATGSSESNSYRALR